MTRLVSTALFFFSFIGLAGAALTNEQQASLDGAYAGIRQKGANQLQRLIAAGRGQPWMAAEIKSDTDQVAAARARYATSPYAKLFEAGFQKEMARVDKPPAQPGGTGGGGGTYLPPTPPHQQSPAFTIPFLFKVVLFFGGLWACKKLWKKPAGSVSAINHDLYAPVELSAQDQKKIADARQRMEQRLTQIEQTAQALQRQIAQAQSQAAAVAARAVSRATAVTASAVAALNQAKPEFDAYLANMEQRFPTAMAPWTHDVWKSFVESPKPETLWQVAVAHVAEEGLNGEKGFLWAKTVPLLAAKGPIVVRCDAASKERGRSVIHNILLRAALAAPAEIKFSLIDPFGMGAGFPMKRLLPRVRPSASSPAEELAAIMEDIRRVNDGVVGEADSFASLTREQRAGEMFEIIAVLDYPGEYQLDPRVLGYLSRIGQAGPRAGRYLILEWNGAPAAAEMARFQNAAIIDVAGASQNWAFDPVAPPEMRQSLIQAVAKIKSEATGGDWDSQVRPKQFFAETSERMLATPVGERLSFWFGENQDRKPCIHGIVAGQSGSGKSSLLHVLITGLAAHYSPDELQLMLVDGKQGVEFEKYRQLPHAQVVCLLTPAAVARSVLQDYAEEMRDRNEKFKEAGVQKLEEYRRVTGLKMPRMLMVVDEYQQLLSGDADRGAQLLTEVLEKGRNAGIHLLLASQTFEARGLPAAAMSHVHLRASMMLAGDYLQGVTAFNSEGKKLIKDLMNGQVVINEESGRDGANHRGAVARLDNASSTPLKKIIEEITTAAGGVGHPVVLSGTTAAPLAENPFVERWKTAPPDPATLQATAVRKVREGGFGVKEWIAADRPIPLWLGRKFDVRGHVVVVMRRGQGQNLLALGSNGGVRLCMLANGLAALRSMRSLADSEILFLDGLTPGRAGDGLLAAGLDVLRSAGAHVERADPETAAAALDGFAARALSPRNPESIRLLILSEPESFPMLATPPGYGVQPTGPARVFRELLQNGPGAGVHSIVTASELTAFSSVLPVRDLKLFNHRVVQQTKEDESAELFTKTIASQITAMTEHPMAAMYVDNVQGVRDAQLFKSYAASSKTSAAI